MGRADNLSPMGLYNWDNTIFDLFQIPEELDRDTLLNNILAETIELEVIYPNPTVFKSLVRIWSNKQLPVWERLYATTQYEYNPIENYNRYETGSDTGTGSTTHSGTDTHTDTSALSGSDTRNVNTEQGGEDETANTTTLSGTDRQSTLTELSGTDETEKNTEHGGEDGETVVKDDAHWIAGYDSAPSGNDDGLVKQTKDSSDSQMRHDFGQTIEETGSITYGKTETGTNSYTYGKTETESGSTSYGKTEEQEDTIQYGKQELRTGNITHGEKIENSNDGSHELHAHGNIGVTTTQKLIREQREVDRFNLYDIITDEFKMRFCILVY